MRRQHLTLVAATCVGVVVSVTAALSPAAAATSPGRQSRTSHIAVAGANVYVWSSHRRDTSGGACTLSFPVRAASGEIGALTAGHCLRLLSGGPPYTVHQTRNDVHHTSDVGDTLGSVAKGEVHAGKDGDNAVVGLAAGRKADPALFVGRAATKSVISVSGSRSVHDGLAHLCYSGASSGEHCGLTVHGPARTITFRQDGQTVTIAHEWAAYGTCAARPGDSGAPVFVRHGSTARAVGILSGGGTVNGQCVTLFTPISLALSSLHVSLLTRR